MTGRRTAKMRRGWLAGSAVAIGALLLGGESAKAQATADFCGCAGSPESLGSFNANDTATWPAGTVDIEGSCYPHIRIPVPESGVLVFDSFTVSNRNTGCGTRNVTVSFVPNAANTPVTLLIRGDLTVGEGDLLSVRGSAGSNGSSGSNGIGGQGGPGGFAGGDGAYQLSNLASDGGAGIGPGGGAGSVAAGRVRAAGGTFFGVPELRPLVGGSGGGGGHSLTTGGSCSGGSGGAIRILASAITGGGVIEAVGAGGGPEWGELSDRGNGGGSGRIRLEAISNSFAVNGTNPVAVRAPAPGPLANPITPTVTITGVDGKATPVNPVGHRGQIDLLVDSPGSIQIDLATTDVPAGTAVEVTAKPKIGRAPFSQRVTLAPSACSGGACTAAVVFELDPGGYILEARATFEAP